MAKKPFPFSVCEQCCVEGGGSGGTITFDTEMSDTSENAVQNKVIKEYVDEGIKSVFDYATNISSNVDNRLTDEMFLMEERINGKLDLKADKSDIGDIETALDNIIAEQEAIIAIQNSLIGGDSV